MKRNKVSLVKFLAIFILCLATSFQIFTFSRQVNVDSFSDTRKYYFINDISNGYFEDENFENNVDKVILTKDINELDPFLTNSTQKDRRISKNIRSVFRPIKSDSSVHIKHLEYFQNVCILPRKALSNPDKNKNFQGYLYSFDSTRDKAVYHCHVDTRSSQVKGSHYIITNNPKYRSLRGVTILNDTVAYFPGYWRSGSQVYLLWGHLLPVLQGAKDFTDVIFQKSF